jgi:hypothetical protein
MSRKLEMYDLNQHSTYDDAKAAGAVRRVDISEFDNCYTLSDYGIRTVMDAVTAAVDMIDARADVVYMLVVDDDIVDIQT